MATHRVGIRKSIFFYFPNADDLSMSHMDTGSSGLGPITKLAINCLLLIFSGLIGPNISTSDTTILAIEARGVYASKTFGRADPYDGMTKVESGETYLSPSESVGEPDAPFEKGLLASIFDTNSRLMSWKGSRVAPRRHNSEARRWRLLAEKLPVPDKESEISRRDGVNYQGLDEDEDAKNKGPLKGHIDGQIGKSRGNLPLSDESQQPLEEKFDPENGERVKGGIEGVIIGRRGQEGEGNWDAAAPNDFENLNLPDSDGDHEYTTRRGREQKLIIGSRRSGDAENGRLIDGWRRWKGENDLTLDRKQVTQSGKRVIYKDDDDEIDVSERDMRCGPRNTNDDDYDDDNDDDDGEYDDYEGENFRRYRRLKRSRRRRNRDYEGGNRRKLSSTAASGTLLGGRLADGRIGERFRELETKLKNGGVAEILSGDQRIIRKRQELMSFFETREDGSTLFSGLRTQDRTNLLCNIFGPNSFRGCQNGASSIGHVSRVPGLRLLFSDSDVSGEGGASHAGQNLKKILQALTDDEVRRIVDRERGKLNTLKENRVRLRDIFSPLQASSDHEEGIDDGTERRNSVFSSNGGLQEMEDLLIKTEESPLGMQMKDSLAKFLELKEKTALRVRRNRKVWWRRHRERLNGLGPFEERPMTEETPQRRLLARQDTPSSQSSAFAKGRDVEEDADDRKFLGRRVGKVHKEEGGGPIFRIFGRKKTKSENDDTQDIVSKSRGDDIDDAFDFEASTIGKWSDWLAMGRNSETSGDEYVDDEDDGDSFDERREKRRRWLGKYISAGALNRRRNRRRGLKNIFGAECEDDDYDDDGSDRILGNRGLLENNFLTNRIKRRRASKLRDGYLIGEGTPFFGRNHGQRAWTRQLRAENAEDSLFDALSDVVDSGDEEDIATPQKSEETETDTSLDKDQSTSQPDEDEAPQESDVDLFLDNLRQDVGRRMLRLLDLTHNPNLKFAQFIKLLEVLKQLKASTARSLFRYKQSSLSDEIRSIQQTLLRHLREDSVSHLIDNADHLLQLSRRLSPSSLEVGDRESQAS